MYSSTQIPHRIRRRRSQARKHPIEPRASMSYNQYLSMGKVQIKWPQACKTTVWEQFDKDVDKVLEASMKGDVDQRLQAMTTIIISLAQERFGAEEKRPAWTT